MEYGFGTGTVGIAGNYSRPRAKFVGNVSRDEADSFQVGGFGGFAIAGAFAQAYLGYGWDDHDIDREGVVEGMRAKTDGDHWLAGAKAGYLFPVGIMRAGPVVAIDYAKAKVDGYTESGDPALTLNVELGERQVVHRRHRRRASRRLRHQRRLRPALSLGDAGEGAGATTTVSSASRRPPRRGSSTAGPLGDGSDGAYGRISGGGSAEILSRVSLNTVLSTTVGRDDGNDVSASVGLNYGF